MLAEKLVLREEREEGIKEGLRAAAPLIIGYIPIAMAFGILGKTAGITFSETVMFSAFVSAGASQFMALNLFMAGAGILQIILTTFLVNSRHFLMSASLSRKVNDKLQKWTPFVAFAMTDEIFSIASFKKEELTHKFMLGFEGSTYLVWVLATAGGFLLGEVLPPVVQDSMGIALYAMFIGILIPEGKKSRKLLGLAILAGILNTILSSISFLPAGWSVIISILGMMIVTYLPRLIPFLMGNQKELPEKFNKFLSYIPATALGALILPGVFNATPDKPIAGIVGILFAIGYSWYKGGIILPVIGAILSTFIVLVAF